MAARNHDDRRISRDVTLLQGKCELIAGRVGVIAAILLFIAGYGYSASEFGILLTIGLAWLPCGAASWITAIMVASLGAPLIRRIISAWRQLALLVRLLVAAWDSIYS